jgi:hypothetical protein
MKNRNNNKNRSRKAKATVRTTKPRTTEQVTRDINARKIKAAFQSKVWNTDPQYRVDFSFTLKQDQDINDPIEYLYDWMGEKVVDRLNTGSGYCMMTGCRDFGFEGSKDEIADVMEAIATSPYRIHRMTVEMLENEYARSF